MADVLLDIGNHLPGIGLVPAPVEVLGHHPKLDDEVAGEVLQPLPRRAFRAKGGPARPRHRP